MDRRHAHESLPSTQAVARDLARAGAPVGSWVVATTQSAGSGRAGHAWASPPGGLYLSWIGPELPRGDPAASLALGAALHELLDERWHVRTELRWPNDLMVLGPEGARKLAGVLCEQVVAEPGARTIVGVGLNVDAPDSSYPPELLGSVVQLSEVAASSPSVRAVEAEVVRQLSSCFRDLQTPAGTARWMAVARSAFFGRGRRVRQGGVELGRIVDLADDGCLALATDHGRTLLRSGAITIEEGA